METTASKKIQIGDVISFDKSACGLAVRRAETLIPAINNLRDQYEKLNLGAFTPEVFSDLYQGGDSIDKIRSALKKQIEKDLKGFKNAIMAEQTMKDAETFLGSLQVSIDDLRRKFMDEASFANYSFTPADFVIEDSQVIAANEPRIREHYTERVQTQAQADAYEKLQHLADVWNDTVDFIEHSGFKFPSSHSLHNVFFVPEKLSENFIGHPTYGPRITVAKKQLKLLMMNR